MRYPHDCSDCDFLGLLDKYDVYYCHRENTMVYRHGIEENYTTMSMRHVAESAKGK